MLDMILGEVNIGPVERALSVAAGAGLIAYAAGRRRRWLGGLPFMVGGNLITRGLTGRSPLYRDLGLRRAGAAREVKGGIRVKESAVILRPAGDLYAFWRNFENLPRVMSHVRSVELLGGGLSRWQVKGPAGSTVEWDAEIVRDRPGESITWQTLPGAAVIHAGSVAFRPLEETGGTEVRVILRYDPPGGAAGAALAGLLGEEPARQVREDLRVFKRLAETGRIEGLSRSSAASTY